MTEKPAEPNKQSSDELATLAAKYLGLDEIGYAQLYRDNPAALWADIRSLAASVLSQAKPDEP